MKALKIVIIVLTIGFLISCRTGREGGRLEEYDKVFATYPKYRIDDKMQKICIIGSGEGRSETTNLLTNFFMRETSVKIVEPGNLQAILGGKIIEYGTGLTHSESQALSQMLQIDHILLFEEKVSPHRDYEYGGRATVTINLKIVDTLNGEVIYQTVHSIGVNYKDPRKYGFTGVMEMPTYRVNDLRNGCFQSLSHELSYAMGRYFMGMLIKQTDDPIVQNTVVNSISDRAGIKIGDKIVEVNGKKIKHFSDIPREETKQGDDVKLKVEREAKILEFDLKIPLIPFKLQEKKKEKPIGQEKTI